MKGEKKEENTVNHSHIKDIHLIRDVISQEEGPAWCGRGGWDSQCNPGKLTSSNRSK